MRYISTRGQAPVRDFSSVLLAGLAEDGGLYLPESWPELSVDDWRALRGLPYPELAARIIAPFAEGSITHDVLLRLCREAYSRFDHPAIVPLTQVEDGLFVQELFHGPTLAFKDMAMQLLGRLFDHVLTERDQKVTIVGATSGDTGSAAIEACRGRERLRVVILHPEGRTSEVQRRQMTTVLEPNVTNLAVKGTFDDCQDLVKAMFADLPFRTDMNLSAVNSINWARIAAQVPYYVYSALALGAPDREVSFAVPTGNFGNVLAAWVARRMGLPIRALCVGSNRNDILSRFLNENDMSIHGVVPSLSPSMDIQVSSNFERLLFELLDRDAEACARIMTDFRKTGVMKVSNSVWDRANALFHGMALDDDATAAEIRTLNTRSHYLADPHTAIGIAAGRAFREPGIPMVAMSTAHPAKFPDAMARATGIRPALPDTLADLYDRPERYTVVPADLGVIEDKVRAAVLTNAP
ncbi:threonine synthase [Komagataeibacter nataicola]|uniref:Threonine synthase n=1 Tax=Komagataeibacter nataicola TaxID=265960 RepID=A0A9N7CBR9_9PROT|nr:threonine synthase [Komagataeibacter nataicola]AQU88267.1 threonine synthase [Komagataeibacter nataicola]PYD67675.1 threonine synthase [Komagataeibacter nataicola]WEQ54629.1 threonine synthase [Komagataeibacter nataicola]WNM08998.1 threonine synthase [Komagataeibacter nataicola]GBR13875.1 threonine synthase [Komagataeibacter nataicola NRIC 0616]